MTYTKMSEITLISQVGTHARCPECASRSVKRSSTPQHTGVSMNGASLWELVEECTMCAWISRTPHVKIGA